VAPDTVRFEAGEMEVTIEDFLVGTLDSLGTISGEIEADSGAVAFAEARLTGETAETTWRSRAVEERGPFSIEVPTGVTYDVRAFVDANADSVAGEEETQLAWEEPVSLRFTASATELRFDLRSPEPEETLELGGAEEDAQESGVDDEASGPENAEPEPAEGDQP
jgi:hypothetical protein